MKTLLILLLALPTAFAGTPTSAPGGAAPTLRDARQDLQGKQPKQHKKAKNAAQGGGAQNGGNTTEPRKRRTQKADKGGAGLAGQDGQTGRSGSEVRKRKAQKADGGATGFDGQDTTEPRKKKEPKPLTVVPMGTERKAKREAEGLTGAGTRAEREGRETKGKAPDAAAPSTVTRAEDAAAVEAPEATAPAPGDEPRERRAPGKPARPPVNLAAELRTHWSRLSRLDQLRVIFLEAGAMEAYQRTDRLRSIENSRFQIAMATLREQVGAPRVDETLEQLSTRGGKWERSDWLRGEESSRLR